MISYIWILKGDVKMIKINKREYIAKIEDMSRDDDTVLKYKITIDSNFNDSGLMNELKVDLCFYNAIRIETESFESVFKVISHCNVKNKYVIEVSDKLTPTIAEVSETNRNFKNIIKVQALINVLEKKGILSSDEVNAEYEDIYKDVFPDLLSDD